MSIDITVEEVVALLQNQVHVPLLDVREDFERRICQLPNNTHLTEEVAQDLLQHADREQLLVFYCHRGGRSLAAAQYFQHHGFKNVKNLAGGIDAWALKIDPDMPRY